MKTDWQTWVALAVVAVAAFLLVRGAWRRRQHHDDCGCAGSEAGRELAKLKKRLARRH